MAARDRRALEESITAVAVALGRDGNGIATSPAAQATARVARETAARVLTPAQRHRMLDNVRGHPDPVFRKAVFVAMADDLPIPEA